jgi:hypothetical protein
MASGKEARICDLARRKLGSDIDVLAVAAPEILAGFALPGFLHSYALDIFRLARPMRCEQSCNARFLVVACSSPANGDIRSLALRILHDTSGRVQILLSADGVNGAHRHERRSHFGGRLAIPAFEGASGANHRLPPP